MRMTLKQLKKCDVETLSGTNLGKVIDIVFDTEGQHIVQYKVKSSMIGGEHLISRDQVVRFEEEKMVVYDTAIPKKEVDKAKLRGAINPGGAAMASETLADENTP